MCIAWFTSAMIIPPSPNPVHLDCQIIFSIAIVTCYLNCLSIVLLYIYLVAMCIVTSQDGWRLPFTRAHI